MSNHNTSSFCLPSSSSWAQSWESSCSQEGEMGHIFLICLRNLSVHHRHLKWVRRSRGIFCSIAACATHRLWAGSGLTDAPSLGKIKKACIDLDRTHSAEFWWLRVAVRHAVSSAPDKGGLVEPDRAWHVNAQTNEVPELTGVNYSETKQRIQMMWYISATTGRRPGSSLSHILGLAPEIKSGRSLKCNHLFLVLIIFT